MFAGSGADSCGLRRLPGSSENACFPSLLAIFLSGSVPPKSQEVRKDLALRRYISKTYARTN
jgi:hypothetical protein